MAAETARRGRKPFPRIRIVVTDGQRRAHLVLAPAAQMAALSGLLCGALLLSYLGVSRVCDPGRIARADSAAMRAELANIDLQDTVARLQDRLARVASERSAAENQLSAIQGQTASISDRLAAAAAELEVTRAPATPPPAAAAPTPDRVTQLKNALAHVQLAVHALTAESATLAARLNKTEADHAEESALSRQRLAHARRATRRRGGRCCVNLTYGGGSSAPELRVWEDRNAAATTSVRF